MSHSPSPPQPWRTGLEQIKILGFARLIVYPSLSFLSKEQDLQRLNHVQLSISKRQTWFLSKSVELQSLLPCCTTHMLILEVNMSSSSGHGLGFNEGLQSGLACWTRHWLSSVCQLALTWPGQQDQQHWVRSWCIWAVIAKWMAWVELSAELWTWDVPPTCF